MCCAARAGTVYMETVDGGLELFQCNTQLRAGSLAAACITSTAGSGSGSSGSGGSSSGMPGTCAARLPTAKATCRAKGDGGGCSGKLWLFCPDPLCLLSKPAGQMSELIPDW